jgi:hypothetical protein
MVKTVEFGSKRGEYHIKAIPHDEAVTLSDFAFTPNADYYFAVNPEYPEQIMIGQVEPIPHYEKKKGPAKISVHAISHESLHRAMRNLNEGRASEAIDKAHIFGYVSDVEAHGLRNLEKLDRYIHNEKLALRIQKARETRYMNSHKLKYYDRRIKA